MSKKPTKNQFRSIKNSTWMQRELSRLESYVPVATGSALVSLNAKIDQARERLQQIAQSKSTPDL